MTKTDAKAKALEVMMESVGTAYYKICDDGGYSKQDEDLICEYITQYGERIAKALKTKYVAY